MNNHLSSLGFGELDRVFGALAGWDDVAGFPFLRTTARRRAAPAGPRFHHVTDYEGLTLWAEVPGVAAEDVRIELEDQTLHLQASRAVEHGEARGQRLERSSFSVDRHWKLPFRPDADGVQATVADGVLTVRLPKAPELAPRTIAVTRG